MTATEQTHAAVVDLYRRHLSKGRASLAELTGGDQEVSSHAAHVFGADGRRFLDCGGYGVFLVGHTHPAVVDAVVAQARTHPMSTRLLLEPTAARAAEALAAVTPPGLERVHFVNSGAEAVEAAIKLARAHGKDRLVSAGGGFHGKTMGALSLTAKELYQAPFRPLLPQVAHVPYGDVQALADSVTADTCLVLEPVQGEGGVVVPPDGYLTEAQRICRERGALLVLDEIQTGLGRLGTWWGADREHVTPDVLLVGKGLSGGVVPVAAMVATDAAYEPFNRDPFLHTSTFAASPIAMAAARAAVETIAGEGMVERAAALGRTLTGELARIVAERCPELVTEIRGPGLLIGMEFKDEHTAGAFVMELHDHGVLVNHSLNAHKVLRFTPPAVLTPSDVDWLLTAFDAAASTLEGTL
ncbi:aminotransferase class III-fold pyridoxal phosphate-dependent enzyme [Kitasatospora sp. NPDC051914]|uniref:aspartate aminotransferase family protein n=1 Tax=Kitasatospora sp. NPDC051914 TaxID=3154945 RepID=UPI00343386AC